MSCVLRIAGVNLNLTDVIESLSVAPYRIWKKGEPRSKTVEGSRLNTNFGVVYDISKAEMSQFKEQISDATRFLIKHQEELRAVARLPGVESMNLDFGIELRDMFVNSDVLPYSFLVAAANSNVSVELSHYPTSSQNT